ncbi:hypothetical protein EIN_243900 [Entamoeba invadens IP1]|uniref:Leucine rich repeat containing protein BspA family protein n=1 Tax=Entamoeba invadens IP1 TaxID=370355 RepID=A0A0A1TZH3_ENTIV|nr:hypothetical protein EIN_243900 [Entamoeba invadens IP1]ELP83949.1 hypothetical protein EIN_243900 [Entamoeba invadens IP1]|eukprot:XP_004183295.1 hypothetical protein EIN_243900 [Entamoeba invadens IP1]
MSTIDGYHMMIVSQYFTTIDDFINLEFVCKKYQNNMEKFHCNPIPLNRKTIKHFPNIETLYIWSRKDETFGNEIIRKTYPPEFPETSSTSSDDTDSNSTDSDDSEDSKKHTKSTNKVEEILEKIDFYKIVIWDYEVYETVTRTMTKSMYANNGISKFEFKRVQYERVEWEYYDDVKQINPCNYNLRTHTYDSKLHSLQIPNFVTWLPDFCFENATDLTSVTLPSKIHDIGHTGFYGCSNLQHIVLPDNLLELNNYAFMYCNLKSVCIPKLVTSIGQNCFLGNKNLSRVEMNNYVTKIGRKCFKGCDSLAEIVLPKSIKVIGECCFSPDTKVIHKI